MEKEWSLKEFQVRVGVNTGLVVAGGGKDAESTVMGTAVNLAARLENSAPPGGILISQQTYQHVRGIFNLEPGEAIQMKGFTEPVQVYLVKDAKPHAFRIMTRGVEGIETPMVGREQEIKTLRESFESVIQSRRSRFITVVGEAGLGKSRLLHEFESWLDQQPIPIVILRGRAALETLDLPYGLLRDMITSHFGILDDEPINVVRNKIVNGFRDAFREVNNLAINAHFTGQLLGYDFHDSPHLRGVMDAPQQLHDRAVVYMIDYFKGIALDNPIIIFLDDIHWADDSSLDIVLHMSDELYDQQVLFVALSRPSLFERRPSWGNLSFHKRLDLHPLTQKDSRHMIEGVLHKVQDVPEALCDLIVSNAEGNPYYLEELIKMLVEDGVIVKGDPKWRVHTERLIDVRVPPTLTGVIQARLDNLGMKERKVLQQASVVGRIFWDEAVLHINRNMLSDTMSSKTESMEIPQKLKTLQNREMVFQREASAFLDTVEYFFKHTILREVTYESVLKSTRREYHTIVADWLITHGGERSGEVAGLIAGHLEKAGKKEEALEYLCQAAQAAASNFAIDEAAEFYSRALALTPEDDLEKRYTLLIGNEMVFGMQGNRDAQRETLETLAMVVDTLAEERKRVEILIRRAWFAFGISEYPEMIAVGEQAVALAQTVNEQGFVGQAKYAVAWAYLQQGAVDRALIYAEDALPLARQVGERRSEGNTLNILGMINTAQGKYLDALSYLENFLAIAREIGDLEREITALNNLGVALTLLGKYQAAQDNFHQVLSIVLETGDQVSESTSLINLAWVTSAQGEWDLALKYAEDGIAMKREFEQLEAVAEGLVWLGNAWIGLEQPENAIRAYQESLEIRQELNLLHLAMESIAGTARAELIQGNMHAAQGRVEEIITYLSTSGTFQGVWEPLRIYLTCYQVLQAIGDQRANEILETAYNLLHERVARIPERDDRQVFLEKVPWHREIVTKWEASQ
jgi:tetratricopeptide (TPR) repeat protein